MSDIIVNDGKVTLGEGITLIYDGNRTGHALDHGHKDVNEYSEDLCNEFYDRYLRHAMIAFDEFNVPIVNPALTSTANHEKRSELIRTLADTLHENIAKEIDGLVKRNIRLKFIGDKEMFAESATKPHEVKDSMDSLEDVTKEGNKLLVLSCAFNHDQEFKKMIEQNPGKSLKEQLRTYYGFEDEEQLPENLIGLLIRTWRPRTSGLQAVGSGNFDIGLLPAPAKFMTDDKFRRILIDYDQRKTTKGGGTVYGQDYQKAVGDFRTLFEGVEPIPQGIVVPDGDNEVWIPLPKTKNIEGSD